MLVPATITALIVHRALCEDCIADQTRMTPEAVDEAINALSRAMTIDRYPNGTCAECGDERLVFAIDRATRG